MKTDKAARDYIADNNKAFPPEWINLYADEYAVSYLSDLYHKLTKENSLVIDEERGVTYEVSENGLATVTAESFELCIEVSALKKIIQVTYDMVMPVLPLGSVVTIDKSNFGEETGELLVVIQQRFIFKNDVPVYFLYGGAIYPFGNLMTSKLLYFTHTMINKVVHLGYFDEAETEAILKTKIELVMERGYSSMGFATDAEKEAYSEFLKGE